MAVEMDYEQKALAMKALAHDVCLHIRAAGDWYCRLPGVEIGGNSILESVGGDGTTPHAAVTDAWKRLTELPAGKYIVVDAMRTTRRQYRWNGFMWADVPVEREASA